MADDPGAARIAAVAAELAPRLRFQGVVADGDVGGVTLRPRDATVPARSADPELCWELVGWLEHVLPEAVLGRADAGAAGSGDRSGFGAVDAGDPVPAR